VYFPIKKFYLIITNIRTYFGVLSIPLKEFPLVLTAFAHMPFYPNTVFLQAIALDD
jgi:hypothetical protein